MREVDEIVRKVKKRLKCHTKKVKRAICQDVEAKNIESLRGVLESVLVDASAKMILADPNAMKNFQASVAEPAAHRIHQREVTWKRLMLWRTDVFERESASLSYAVHLSVKMYELRELDLFKTDEVELLQSAYLAYRSAVHYQWLGGEMASYSQLNEYRLGVVSIWNKYMNVESTTNKQPPTRNDIGKSDD